MSIDAAELARLIYRASETVIDWTDRPDGTEVLHYPNGYTLNIANDSSDEEPYGITWWIDGPEETCIESSGYGTADSGAVEELVKLMDRK